MSNIYFTSEIISDLLRESDKSFVQRVWRNVFTANGDFKLGANDHRYHGIKDAWIRYVSSGKTAYRIIYIRKGADIYLFRAGPHSIEDNLSPPTTLDTSVGNQEVEVEQEAGEANRIYKLDTGELLVTRARLGNFPLIPDYFHKMFHVSHDEIMLISPFIDHDLLKIHSQLGSFLDKQLEEGAVVTIISRPPVTKIEQKNFENLATRGIEIYFYKSLHAKLYLFEIDKSSLNKYNKNQVCKVAILGSSNLTEMGLGLGKTDRCNDELCYRPEDYRYDEFRNYAHYLTIGAQDFVKFKSSLGRF